MTGVEDQLRDVDSNMRQPDIGLTLERRAADELEKRGDTIRRLWDLLTECNEAMGNATRRWRTSAGLAGNSTDVPGAVAWLDEVQEKIRAEQYREAQL